MSILSRSIIKKIISPVLAFSVMASGLAVPVEVIAQTKNTKKKTAAVAGKKSASSGANNKKNSNASTGTKGNSTKGTGTKSTGTKGTKGTSRRGNAKSGNAKSANSKSAKSKNVSSAELKKRQQSLQAEVNAAKEELRRNQASVKQGLSELAKLDDDIQVSRKETDALGAELQKIGKNIDALEAKIAGHEKELDRLRAEYLKAVKKMRVSKKKSSNMAYLFGAKNLAQAERRMRYMKEFSEWKDRQTSEIDEKVVQLKKENETLRAAKSDKDVILGRELKAQKKLSEQKERQSAVVADLKANGEALNAHLAQKQSEVNQLRNQVAAVIAEEQRKAEEQRRAEERRRAEEARKAEAARRAEEERERKAEEARKAEEIRKQEEAAKASEAAKADKSKEQPKKETKKEQPEKSVPKKSEPKKSEPSKSDKKDNKAKEKQESRQGKDSKGDYASARKRQPRNSGESNKTQEKSQKRSEPKQPAAPAKPSSGKDFAAARGSLPRPVSGSWRIVSQFGKHSLPDLPHVTYDNPGIDAEVAKGANAQAVFEGTVSGVYMIPGFSTVVIVNHGDYYTVYGNIASAAVKVGDKVSQGQTVGKLAVDPDNPSGSEIHFEVWKGREKLNPASWIR